MATFSTSPVPTASADLPPTISPAAADRWLRLPPGATPPSPWLHEEVARRMEQRLEWIVAKPGRWAHWEALRGGLAAHALVQQRYPDAGVDVVESTPERAAAARTALEAPWWSPRRWGVGRSAPRFMVAPGQLPAPRSIDMLWANMALHTAADPQALIARWHQALAVDGYLMFSCFGPDTLRELRRVYAEHGWPAAGHAFTDMHDWGDMLVHAGFAEPVMDMERIVLTYETPERLLAELREIGRNLHPARFPGLRGRGFRARLAEALAQGLASPAEDGRLMVTFEIVYGHAFKPVPRARVAAESAVGLDDMRRMLRRGPSAGA
ncbi:biotin synthase [Xylophilus sp. Kf1]|nr:biotin synthase [Xylophilus sp. Kf1]